MLVLHTCTSTVQDVSVVGVTSLHFFFFFQAEDGIRDLVRSRGLGDVYKRQEYHCQLAGSLFRQLLHPD